MAEEKLPDGVAMINEESWCYDAEPDPPLEAYSSLDEHSTSCTSTTDVRDTDIPNSHERLVLQVFDTPSSDDGGSVVDANPFRDDPYGNIDTTPDACRSLRIEGTSGTSLSRSYDEESSSLLAEPVSLNDHIDVSPTGSRMEQHASFRRMIDNTALFYVPLRLRCDVVAMCRPEVLARCPQVLHDLNADLFQCLRMLPLSVHALVRRTKIWINASYQYGPVDDPQMVGHSTAHHHDGWLVWARDKREKVLGIEIYSCFDYQRMRLHWNGAGLILHELCHLIHQQVLPGGLENECVKDCYRMAKKSGRYDEVPRRDWAGRDCDTDMAYCMVNHKEFFAEMSVTYFADGYTVLDRATPASIEPCYPPLMSPAVIERMKKKAEAQKRISLLESTTVSPKSICLRSLSSACCDDESDVNDTYNEPQQFVGRLFGRGTGNLFSKLFSGKVKTLLHCNKFFPFTRGQLSMYDNDLMSGMSRLWKLIEDWDDYDCDSGNCSRLGCIGWKGEGVHNNSVW
eukprot:CAMPEP_0113582520 /NCGR_PEP_ID=MMETSP0015_2-20120614/31965_1 /TAXON_ID=2838 /ORGANISM="Odontella" /LENGTH=511 /DNA_ID=CAMNT_0000487211 /DNA_START=30 /DNA_END=1562 /DNA_ORIENTATION=- /assembly_acc=CAM_ASM_000160